MQVYRKFHVSLGSKDTLIRIPFRNTTDKVPCNETYGKVWNVHVPCHMFPKQTVLKVHGNFHVPYHIFHCKVKGNSHVPYHMFHRKIHTWKLPCTMRYVSLQGTWKFPCTIPYVSSQGTWKCPCILPRLHMFRCKVHGNFYTSCQMFACGVNCLRGTWKFPCSLQVLHFTCVTFWRNHAFCDKFCHMKWLFGNI